jgi:hypothetical protein
VRVRLRTPIKPRSEDEVALRCVCTWPFSAAPVVHLRVRYQGDCVAKLFFGVRANFSRGAGAFAPKLCRGAHEQRDFRRVAFVSSSQGIVSPKTHFDGQIAKFPARSFLSFATQSGAQPPRLPRSRAAENDPSATLVTRDVGIQ